VATLAVGFFNRPVVRPTDSAPTNGAAASPGNAAHLIKEKPVHVKTESTAGGVIATMLFMADAVADALWRPGLRQQVRARAAGILGG